MIGTSVAHRVSYALFGATLAVLISVGVLSATASAGRNFAQGPLCYKAWNNADYEDDFFWAATGHWHGPWYEAYGEHCHKVKASIRRLGEFCRSNWPGPGQIYVTRTQSDGYVTISTFISPSQRDTPSSDHRAWNASSGHSEERFLCFQ
jgi:hypothetical protein